MLGRRLEVFAEQNLNSVDQIEKDAQRIITSPSIRHRCRAKAVICSLTVPSTSDQHQERSERRREQDLSVIHQSHSSIDLSNALRPSLSSIRFEGKLLFLAEKN